jgi:hypothetical protein
MVDHWAAAHHSISKCGLVCWRVRILLQHESLGSRGCAQFEESPMNHFLLKSVLVASAAVATLTLSACDKPVNVNPPAPIVTPGPAGATGATGAQGNQGNTGATGDTGAPGMPAASSPAASMPKN